MKHLIKNNQIVMSGIPTHFTRENGEGFWGGYEERTDLHYEDGWRDEVVPEHDPELDYLGEMFYDAQSDRVSYLVLQRPDLPALELAKTRKIREIKRVARDLLSETDYYIIRKYESGKAVPDPVLSQRMAVRAKSDLLEDQVMALTSIRDVLHFSVKY